ncbi:hypothetical protein D1AOALGA4SA_3026 [Olavius algarvensis Delta 1 endosymbiont]|nr:hypothetical protein D1AOALGA4SA_3026 [Olavius algarvensis Delta 1 endosymbiont]
MRIRTIRKQVREFNMKFAVFTISCLVILSVAPGVGAQRLYTWIDENGVTHITDTPPPSKAKLEDSVEYRACA